MAIVVRLGPPLGRRRPSRDLELEHIFATAVEIVEVFDVAGLAAAMEMNASGSEELAGAVAVAGHRPVLRPLWRRERNSRGEVDELFDGYGLLTTVQLSSVTPLNVVIARSSLIGP